MTPKSEATMLALYQMLEEMVDLRAKVLDYELALSSATDSGITSGALQLRLQNIGQLQAVGWVSPMAAAHQRREFNDALDLLEAALRGDNIPKETREHAKALLRNHRASDLQEPKPEHGKPESPGTPGERF
jgi:hypothetical protein